MKTVSAYDVDVYRYHAPHLFVKIAWGGVVRLYLITGLLKPDTGSWSISYLDKSGRKIKRHITPHDTLYTFDSPNEREWFTRQLQNEFDNQPHRIATKARIARNRAELDAVSR